MAYIRSEMKTDAKNQLSNNWGAFIGALLVLMLVSGVISVVFYPDPWTWDIHDHISLSVLGVLGGVIQLLVLAPVNLGWYSMSVDATYNRPIYFSSLFNGFKRIWDAVFLAFFYGLFISLWTLLLIIPGIIKTYSYAMSYYIMADDPNVKSLEAITRSRRMMDGHKVELLVLHLSFIPWLLLVVVTFGLASLYVAPYVDVTMANFYRRLKAENEVMAFSNSQDGAYVGDNAVGRTSHTSPEETAAPVGEHQTLSNAETLGPDVSSEVKTPAEPSQESKDGE